MREKDGEASQEPHVPIGTKEIKSSHGLIQPYAFNSARST
jgi:hypothetical protein